METTSLKVLSAEITKFDSVSTISRQIPRRRIYIQPEVSCRLPWRPRDQFDVCHIRLRFRCEFQENFRLHPGHHYLGKLTASFGLRYDKETGGVNPLTQPAFTWYEPGNPHHGERLWPSWNTDLEITQPFKPDAAWSLISPRISFTYDITGDGKNVVKVSAADTWDRAAIPLAVFMHPGVGPG